MTPTTRFAPLALLTLCLMMANFAYAQKKVPSVIVTTLDGQKVDFAKYVEPGTITVVSFWATWCGPCQREINNIKEVLPDWQKQYKIKFIAVSTDDSRNMAKVKPMADGQRWAFTVLIDPNGELKRALGFQTIPQTFLFDSTGTVVYSHEGYTDGDEFELEKEIAKAK